MSSGWGDEGRGVCDGTRADGGRISTAGLLDPGCWAQTSKQHKKIFWHPHLTSSRGRLTYTHTRSGGHTHTIDPKSRRKEAGRHNSERQESHSPEGLNEGRVTAASPSLQSSFPTKQESSSPTFLLLSSAHGIPPPPRYTHSVGSRINWCWCYRHVGERTGLFF